MPYVQRDESGNINGLFANAQNWTNEFLPGDDASVAAFLDPVPLDSQLSADISANSIERLELPTTSDRLDALESRMGALEAKLG